MAVFLKKVFPVFLIGLTTASSAAAFLENRKVCEEKLGIDKKIVNIGVPLGQVIFMPGFSVLYFVMGICMAEIYGVKISIWTVFAVYYISAKGFRIRETFFTDIWHRVEI